jgi:hypothetical protein
MPRIISRYWPILGNLAILANTKYWPIILTVGLFKPTLGSIILLIRRVYRFRYRRPRENTKDNYLYRRS